MLERIVVISAVLVFLAWHVRAAQCCGCTCGAIVTSFCINDTTVCNVNLCNRMAGTACSITYPSRCLTCEHNETFSDLTCGFNASSLTPDPHVICEAPIAPIQYHGCCCNYKTANGRRRSYYSCTNSSVSSCQDICSIGSGNNVANLCNIDNVSQTNRVYYDRCYHPSCINSCCDYDWACDAAPAPPPALATGGCCVGSGCPA